jgi:NADH-quinone oxidoreductase subunit J
MGPTFLLLAGLILGGALAAMSLRNPVHCALCLVVTFVGLAGIYLRLGAEFLGLAQVLVYVGAVAILLVFVVLLTRGGGTDEKTASRGPWLPAVLAGGLVGAVLVAAILSAPPAARRLPAPQPPAVREIGEALMTDFVMPLQAVGVLLTAALIGAAVLAMPERRVGRPSNER